MFWGRQWIRALLVYTKYSICRTITQRQLESFPGKLSFAARVITPGRNFMRRLWDTCKRYSKPHYRVHLSEDALSDIKWWHRLPSDWNGKSFFLSSRWTLVPEIQLFTDACGTISWGACYGNRWLQDKWSPHQTTHDIVWKEMYAIAAACTSWGNEWQGIRILVYCDNEAVVACLTSSTGHSPPGDVTPSSVHNWDSYARHSFRIGTARTAAITGLLDHVIRAAGVTK